MKTKNIHFILLAAMTTMFGFGFSSCSKDKKNDPSTPPPVFGSMKDIEGNVYKTITIGTQTWMAENLKTTKYNDSTAIPNVTDATAWGALTIGAWCDYNNTTDNDTKYGKLYNWYAVNTGKLAPAGWHIPTDAEWTTLNNYITSIYGAGAVGKVLATTTDWSISTSPNAIGNDLTKNNITGFSALPGGVRGSAGVFGNIGNEGDWWSSTPFATDGAWSRIMGYDNGGCLFSGNYYMADGVSVRCVKD